MEFEHETVARLMYAVDCAFDPRMVSAGGALERRSLQQQATEFCEAVRKSPQGWRISISLLHVTGCNAHAKFFGLSTLQNFMSLTEEGVPILDQASRREVREGLLRFISEKGIDCEEAFIRTKLAVVLALCLKSDYPECWPSGFTDLLQLLPRGPTHAELFVRVLVAVDEEIVAYHIDRTPTEVFSSTEPGPGPRGARLLHGPKRRPRTLASSLGKPLCSR
jgi:hypothetical protein